MKPKEIPIIRIIIGLIVVGGILLSVIVVLIPDTSDLSASPTFYVAKDRVFTDHSNMIIGPFEDGPAVTRSCLGCHPEAGDELPRTQHWLWLGEEVEIPGRSGTMRIGKANTINNFCIGVMSNWVKCVSCHIGYGWADENFDFSKKENIDCLVCHDRTGQYAKAEYGLPRKGVDLVAAAKSVTTPGRSNCGACHFNGGGGNGVKHGDLDGSLTFPSPRIDVHMGKYDMLCVDCHDTVDHRVPGRSMGVSVDNANRVLCVDCHYNRLHKDERINAHDESVECQTCHISKIAKDDPTKIWWDWSTAGQDLNINDKHVYLKIKGHFKYGRNIEPEYFWYNGTSDRYILGEEIDPSKVTNINYPLGNIHDKKAKIFPFKIHRGKQPYDKINKILLSPTTAGKGGFWHDFDWMKALRLGAKAAGIPFSGKYGFTRTNMYWKISHMVAPKENALQCVDCHGENGRMNWKRLGYEGDPIKRGDRKRLGMLDATKVVLMEGEKNESN